MSYSFTEILEKYFLHKRRINDDISISQQSNILMYVVKSHSRYTLFILWKVKVHIYFFNWLTGCFMFPIVRIGVFLKRADPPFLTAFSIDCSHKKRLISPSQFIKWTLYYYCHSSGRMVMTIVWFILVGELMNIYD